MDLSKLSQDISRSNEGDKLPPVDQWNPSFCGDMNLVIKRNGDWWHEGTPFTRVALVKLFASVIKKEGEQYFLVTPVEKIGIQVEDVPFVIIDWQYKEHHLNVTTQTGDQFTLSPTHPVELRMFEGNAIPYCLVRRNLWARVNQNVYYQWVESASQNQQAKNGELCWQSGDYSFSLGTF